MKSKEHSDDKKPSEYREEDMPVDDAVLLSLVDQPLVTAKELGRLVEVFRESHSSIAASKYQSGTESIRSPGDFCF
jgi:hypothetical protein